MKEVIPLDPSLASYDFEVELSLKSYKFDIEWNTRSEFWTIYLYDAQNNLIAQAVPQTNYPLFINNSNENLPDGLLWIIDQTGKNQDITRTNFGTDIILVYETLD